ncbi:MAG: methionyl-tRNA formyltransferase [Deltaproteobacteria bacterium]|nr:methionyl-tRNA formyltransferase [Deltaproteobacteria bacterium]
MKNELTTSFPDRPEIIFMGTPDFAVPSLKALIKDGHNVLSVVTQPDRPKGRGRKLFPSPVKRVAREYGIEILQPEKASDGQFCDTIRSLEPDLLIVVAFGRILKNKLLTIPRWGALNIHASLLPKYRGAAPIHWAILNNETKTGLTAMRMDEGLDTGPVLLQEEVAIIEHETAGSLHDRLAGLSGDFIIKTLKGLAKNRLKKMHQDPNEATYATKIDRGMSLIKWDQPANAISGLIRALDPWPGAFTTLEGKEIKLFLSRVTGKEARDEVPGRVAGQSEGALLVETGKGLIEITELQIPGKKRLPAGDFLRGFALERGTVLGS